MLLAVNYHYIRLDTHSAYPGIHPTTPDQLKNQLHELGRDFDFISLPTLRRLIQNQNMPEQDVCIITFDDGLREQYTLAAPLLDDMKIPAAFFINTSPLIQAKVLLVHKIHWLRSVMKPAAFLEHCLQLLHAMGINYHTLHWDDAILRKQYLYDDDETRKIKYLLNHGIDQSTVSTMIDKLFSQNTEESSFCQKLYMDKMQIVDLAQRHSIGSHSHLHQPMTSLPPEKLDADLRQSKAHLTEITQQDIFAISYPYGGPTAISWAVAQAAQKANYDIGFTMERAVNPTFQHPLLFSRLSTNDVWGGNSNTLCRGVNGRVQVQEPTSSARKTHFIEKPNSKE